MHLFFSYLLNGWPVFWIPIYKYIFYNYKKKVKYQLLTVSSSQQFSPVLKGYLPANKERRELVLQRKREEYFGFIEQYYHSRTDEHYKDTYRQVEAAVPPQLRLNKDQEFPSPKSSEYHLTLFIVIITLLNVFRFRSTSTFREPTHSSPCSSSLQCKR